MKILIFSTAYLPFTGGAELAVKEITGRLPEHSFALITARMNRALPRRERLGNVEVYRVGFGFFFDKWLLPFLGFRLAKKLERSYCSRTNGVSPTAQKDGYFDLIWSIMASQASIAAARFKKAFPDKRLVLTLQEGDEEDHLKRYAFGIDFLYRLFIRPWHTLAFKRADAITAISNYLAERARRNNPRAPITVVPNGADLKRFMVYDLGLKNVEKEKTRKELGIKSEDKVIITASRLVTKNGIGDLIEAMRYLPENVKLIICGSGPLEFNLKLTAIRYTLNARVRFLGRISHEELPKYLRAADVFCRPSLSEGMGSAFIEAMAAGLPVVATRVGGITDFLRAPRPVSPEEKSLFFSSRAVPRSFAAADTAVELENQWREKITGLFCARGDPKDTAEKIQLILSNDELRKRIIENGSEMVREKYDWGGIAEQMKAVLTKNS